MTLPNKVTYLLIMCYAVYVHVHRQGNSIVYSVILFEIKLEVAKVKIPQKFQSSFFQMLKSNDSVENKCSAKEVLSSH